MRWRQVAILTGMLLRFLARRAARTGSRAVRGFVPVALVAFSVVFARLAMMVFAGPSSETVRVEDNSFVTVDPPWNPMLDAPTLIVVLATLTVLVLFKIVFLNTAGLLDLTVHLPLTSRERAAALLGTEAVAVAALTLPINGAFAVAVATGPQSDAGTALVVVVLPTMLAYLVATVLFELLGHLAEQIGLARVRDHAATMVLAALLYADMANLGLGVGAMDQAAFDGTDPLVWQAGLAWLSRRHGLALPVLGGTLAVVVLTGLALRCIPARRPPAARYLLVLRVAARRGWIGPYDLASLRSTETVMAVLVSSVVFVLLWVTGSASPLFGLAALALPALRHYPVVRYLHSNGPRPSAVSIFGRLLRTPLLLVGTLTLFEVPLVVLTGTSVPEVLVPLGVALTSVVVVTCLGSAFPAETGIPLKAMVSAWLVGAALGLVGIGSGLLGLPAAVSIVVIGTLLLVLMAYAVHKIKAHDASDRHVSAAWRPSVSHGPAGQVSPPPTHRAVVH